MQVRPHFTIQLPANHCYNLPVVLLFVLVISLLWQILVSNSLFPAHFASRNFFFFDLINFYPNIPVWSNYLSLPILLVFFWLIGKKLFLGKVTYLPALLFGFSPWSAYLLSAGSIYPLLLVFILALIYGVLILDTSKDFLGKVLIITGSLALLYSSLLTLIVAPLLFVGAFLLKIIPLGKMKMAIICIVLLFLPLAAASVINFSAVKNLFTQQVAILADPGIIQGNNVFLGQARGAGLGLAAKFAENKYEYLGKYLTLKTLKNLSPATFFTPQEKLLGYSFTPPLYLGLILPFFYGLYLALQKKLARKCLLLSLVLIVPSVLSQPLVDLNRLILFLPVMVFLISWGLIKIPKPILLAVALLVILQIIVTISDIQSRERPRFLKYYGNNCLEISKQ